MILILILILIRDPGPVCCAHYPIPATLRKLSGPDSKMTTSALPLVSCAARIAAKNPCRQVRGKGLHGILRPNLPFAKKQEERTTTMSPAAHEVYGPRDVVHGPHLMLGRKTATCKHTFWQPFLCCCRSHAVLQESRCVDDTFRGPCARFARPQNDAAQPMLQRNGLAKETPCAKQSRKAKITKHGANVGRGLHGCPTSAGAMSHCGEQHSTRLTAKRCHGQARS